MADSRKPYQRIIKIHQKLELRYPHAISKKDLMDICQVAERTLKGDLIYMRDVLDAPVVYDRVEKGYRYKERFDLGQQLGLTSQQLNQLRLGLEIITQLENIQLPQQGLYRKMKQKLQFAGENPYSKHIIFEQVPYYQGAELVGFFLEAIQENRVVQLEYESYVEPGLRTRRFHPYVLKERENRWYVIGRLPEFNNALVTYALDRVVHNDNLLLLEEKFQRDAGLNLEEHFRYTYGMTVKNEPIQIVRLQFTALQAKYFKSKPFFPYQTEEDNEQRFIICMQIIPNWEFVHKILSLGSGVKVLSPKSLAEEVKQELRLSLEQYS